MASSSRPSCSVQLMKNLGYDRSSLAPVACCSACNIANGANADCKGCLINATSFATVKACLGKRYMPVVAKQCVPPNRLGATSPYIACPGSCQVVPCATYSKVDGTCIDGSCCGPTTSTCSGVKFCGLHHLLCPFPYSISSPPPPPPPADCVADGGSCFGSLCCPAYTDQSLPKPV